MTEIRKAIIIAGGYGERMRPFTGLMHKGTLPVAGKPNLVWLCQKLKEMKVHDVYIATHYMHHDIFNVLRNGERFQGLNVHYSLEHEQNETASKVARIVTHRFKREFEKEENVWVFACDVGAQKADLNGFKNQFLAARQKNSGILGQIACFARPLHEIVKKRPTVEIDSDGLVTEVHSTPPFTIEEAEVIRRRMDGDPDLELFESSTGQHALPLPTLISLLRVDALRSLPDVLDREQSDVDFYRSLYKAFPNQIRAAFIKEAIVNGILLPGFYDLNHPEDFYRAEWQVLRNAHDLVALDHKYDERLNSYVAETAEIADTENEKDKALRTSVRSCVLDPVARMLQGVKAEFSWIGYGSTVQNAVIRRSILLPHTNVMGGPGAETAVIEDSIVGGAVNCDTLFWKRFAASMKIKRKIATPDLRKMIGYDKLDITDADAELAEFAFRR